MTLLEKLNNIQTELKCKKSQRNTFGNYNFRSQEDILEAVKPYLEKLKLVLELNDEIVLIGDRYYIKARITLLDVESIESLITTAYAREQQDKKGMDWAQITGAASSYARKYALSGMFALDNSQDADSDENPETNPTPTQKKEIKTKPTVTQVSNLKTFTGMVFNVIPIENTKKLTFELGEHRKMFTTLNFVHSHIISTAMKNKAQVTITANDKNEVVSVKKNSGEVAKNE